MDDGLQVGPRAWVGKDDAPQRTPVQATVFAQDSRAEALAHTRETRTVRSDRFSREDIRVDHRQALVREHLSDRALSAGDATREADPAHALVGMAGACGDRNSSLGIR